VAFAWAVSLGGEAGAKLLQKFGLIEQAIDYAIESNAFQHAFELCRTAAKDKLPEARLKYAMYLEDEGRFKEAEEEFVEANKPKEAIDMYLHNQDWVGAMRVAENHAPAAVADVLAAQGKLAWERKETARAEQMYLKAKKPEQIVELYSKARMWNDAIRLCKEYLPHKLSEVNNEAAMAMDHSAVGGGGSAVSDVMANGRVWEENKDYSQAIDSYLKMTTASTQNVDQLEEAWEKAVQLAMTYCHDRIGEVVGTVTQRLVSLRRFAQAAEMNETIGQFKQAVDIYILAGVWEKARALAANVGPEFSEQVENQYISRMQSEGRVDDLLSSGKTGSVEAGLDALASAGHWDRLYKECQQQGHSMEIIHNYQAKHLAFCIRSGDYQQALASLQKHGQPLTESHTLLYSKIALLTLAAGETASLDSLKMVLSQVVEQMKGSGNKRLREHERLLLITDLSLLKDKIRAKSLEHSAKISISLLRYVGDLPADRSFYEAGMSCRDMGWQNMAFVFLNRYLDLSEAIEDGERTSGGLDNSDFQGTEIPYDYPLPSEQWLDEEKREEVRDWVLQLSMDGSVLQSLSEQTEIPFVRENLRLEDTREYWRVLETDYDVPAGPVAPMILRS